MFVKAFENNLPTYFKTLPPHGSFDGTRTHPGTSADPPEALLG